MNYQKIITLSVSIIITLCLLCSCTATKVPEDNRGKDPSDKISSTVNQNNQDSDSSTEKGQLFGVAANSIDGKTIENTFDGNKLTMINIWATWCPPCKSEMPELNQLAKNNEDRGLVIFGVLHDSEDEGAIDTAQSFLRKNVITFTQLRLDSVLKDSFPQAGSIVSLPTTFFVDENGNILHTVVGARGLDEWQEIVDKYLD